MFCISRHTEELEDSALLSSSADSQTEPHELSSETATELSSALASTDTLSDSGVPPAELSHLVTESTDPPGSLCESSDSPSPPPRDLSPPEPPAAEPSVPAEDPPCKSPADLPRSSQAVEDATWPVEEPAEPLDMAAAHHCSHESDEEEPEEEPPRE